MKRLLISTITALSATAILMATPTLSQGINQEWRDLPPAMEQKSDLDAKFNMADKLSTDAIVKPAVLLGQVVWSSDGEEMGKVSKLNFDSKGSLESIYFDIGSLLDFGGKTVMSEAPNFSQNEDRIELKIDAEAAKALPAIWS